MDKEPIGILSKSIDEEIFEKFSGNLFIDHATNIFVEMVENHDLDFEDGMFQSIIAVNCLVGHMKLLRLCADKLTDDKKEYHTIMAFLDKLQEIADTHAEMGHELYEELGL